MAEFLRNCWYMAAWADEIEQQPFATRLLDEPLVLFRDQAGLPIALGGMCPHRFAPLSRGHIVDDTIACAYHGLRFDRAGQCVHSPFGVDVPQGCSIPAYKAVELYQAIWIWPGDQALADPALIPDFSYHGDPALRVVRGRSKISCNYELVTDNLMDLTHARFLHPIFGGDDWQPEVSFSQNGDTVFSHYVLPPYPPSPFSDAIMPAANGRLVVEREFMRWDAPCNMYLDIQFSWSDAPGMDEVPQPSTHILTPETEGSTHYFWASGVPRECAMTDEDHAEGLRFAFDEEDAPMLEAVSEMIAGRDFWDMRPAILQFDQGGVRARRILKQKIRHEQQSA